MELSLVGYVFRGLGVYLVPGVGPEEVAESNSAVKDALDAGARATPDAGAIVEREVSPRDAAPPSPARSAATTYTEHVRPIVMRECASCHSAGNIAPISLETYEQAEPFAKLMAKTTRARTMPPSVLDNMGACNTFRDLPWLTEDERIGRTKPPPLRAIASKPRPDVEHAQKKVGTPGALQSSVEDADLRLRT